MTIDEIKELIRVVNETQIAELEVQRDKNRVRITRSHMNREIIMPATVGVSQVPVPAVAVAPPVQATLAGPVQGATTPDAVPRAAEGTQITVNSPIVGTYYDAPSPGSPPFVNVGDRVQPRQVLCIIESMKLMNEIEAETSGVIVAKLIENGRPVEYGEALFTIRPD